MVVMFASRACGGRGSVGRERPGQGGLLSVSPWHRADERRCQASSRQQVSGSVDRAGNTAAKWRAVRTAKPCGPGRRCYGQALANAAVAPTGAVPATFAGAREARRNSAPGRARHKLSDHRAGKAVCWASPVCCCAVLPACAFSRSGPRLPPALGLPCALLAREGRATKQSSGEFSRENAKARLQFACKTEAGSLPNTRALQLVRDTSGRLAANGEATQPHGAPFSLPK